MIAKQADHGPLPCDAQLCAGIKAEAQMAFYLNRDFANDPKLVILNDLRLIDAEQPDHNGRPGVCQIDHLALHRWGAFIIESKSVTDAVTVRNDGAGGDEWTRRYRGREEGFASPIQQARRQGEFLRSFLQRHNRSLLGETPAGLRTLKKILAGTDHRGFLNMPIQIIVAISDGGKIRRVNKWQEPTRPFQTFVSKADNVGIKVRDELSKHIAASSLLAPTMSNYGLWLMKAEEVTVVAEFLKSQHQPRTTVVRASVIPARANRAPDTPTTRTPAIRPPAPAAATDAACKNCGGTDLTGKWGKYGYYWKCAACDTNTRMPAVCSACGARGQHGKGVKVRKSGPTYRRACELCGTEEQIWSEA